VYAGEHGRELRVRREDAAWRERPGIAKLPSVPLVTWPLDGVEPDSPAADVASRTPGIGRASQSSTRPRAPAAALASTGRKLLRRGLDRNALLFALGKRSSGSSCGGRWLRRRSIMMLHGCAAASPAAALNPRGRKAKYATAAIPIATGRTFSV
jgi:hypothetical protein